MRSPIILIADDSTLVRAMLRRQLEAQGYQIVEAEDGDEAVTAAARSLPDVILLDVEMPNRDGIGVLKELKATPSLADIPVVFLTSRITTEAVVNGLSLGAHDYLGKPFEPVELVARVHAALRVKALHDELRSRNEELDRTSRIDVLTGLCNRRQMEQELLRLFAAAQGRGEPLGALMIDVDHFKMVNDELGHAAGDTVLRSIATTLNNGVSSEDVVGRWGGEEFLVLTNTSDGHGLLGLAERVRADVERSTVHLTDGHQVQVTVSVGCAASASGDPEGLLRNADRALYAAKNAGRNAVRLATAPDPAV